MPARAGFFLPRGFPDSVAPDYLPYQLWAVPCHVTGWMASSLATSSLLQARWAPHPASQHCCMPLSWTYQGVRNGVGQKAHGVLEDIDGLALAAQHACTGDMSTNAY